MRKMTVAVLVLCLAPLVQAQDRSDETEREISVLRDQVAKLTAERAELKDRLRAMEKKLRSREEQMKARLDEHHALLKKAHAKGPENLERLHELLTKTVKEHGRKHAYADHLKSEMKKRLVRLQDVLQDQSNRLGPQHPNVVSLKQQIDRTRATIAKEKQQSAERDKKQTSQRDTVHQAALRALERAQKSLKNSPDSPEARRVLHELLLARQAADTKRRLAERGLQAKADQADAILNERTQQMLEMQRRLDEAAKLRDEATRRFVNRQADSGLSKRMDKLEQKLDKLSGLVQKLLDRD